MSTSHPSSKRRHTGPLSSGIEPLEPRIAPAATSLAVGRALDLNDGVSIILSGNPASIATMKLGATGQLLGFPSGPDGDFLVLSTGIASQLTSLANTGDNQGTDLGPTGADGDSAAVSFSIDVPAISSGSQRFKLDFAFLTEEYPELVGSAFNDTFTVTINGVDYAVDTHGHPMGVNNDFFTGAPATGTYFDGTTGKLSLTYAVPAGVTTLNVELRISDVGDGQGDSAVLVDNVRFETAQKIFLNFDGTSLNDHFGPGISAVIPAFNPADIGSNETKGDLINEIMTALQQKYAAYDITFTAIMPGYGSFSTIVVGGDNSLQLDLAHANPLLQARFPGGTGSVTDVFGLGSDALLGLSGAPDVGNLDHNDKAVIFSAEFASFFPNATPEERLDHLVVTIAHELGHELGLRHVTDANPGDIMSATAPRSSTATFGSTLLQLAEQWSDGVQEQNDDAYLGAILGGAGSGATGLHTSLVASPAVTNFLPKLAQTLYNTTIHISTGDADGGGITLHFDKLDATQNISLPRLPLGALISIAGASSKGGPIDTFTGTPHAGMLTDADTSVPLFDGQGHLASLTLSKLQTGGGFTGIGTVPLTDNVLGNVNVLPGKTATFTDEDGDLYTIKLVGPGTIGYRLNDPDLNGQGGLAQLVLDGTTFGQSTLSITVKRGINGDGRVDVGEITGTAGAGLKTLSAAALDFTGGGIVFSGALGAVSIGDLSDGSSVIGGAAMGGKSTLRLHAVADGAQISLGTDVTLLQAARLGDASIAVPSLTKLLVTGDAKAGLSADLAAQVHVAGLLGALSAGDIHSTGSIFAGGSPLDRTVLAMRAVADGASISLASAVTSLRATAIGDASFNAQQFGTVTLTGSLAGDFTAIGNISRLTARDLLGTASITSSGLATDKTTLVLGVIHDAAAINLESTLSVLRAVQVGDASITAAAIGVLSVTGNVSTGTAGSFAGTLTLQGGDSAFKNSLGTATFAGMVNSATISAESIGTFSAAGVSSSMIYAGYSPADPLHPMDGGVFFDGGFIKSFVVRGANPGLSDSIIASKTITTIRVLGLDSDNAGTAFGIITDTVPLHVSVKGFTYDKAGAADQVLGDFHLKVT